MANVSDYFSLHIFLMVEVSQPPCCDVLNIRPGVLTWSCFQFSKILQSIDSDIKMRSNIYLLCNTKNKK